MAEAGGWALVLSCEHGGNKVPDLWRGRFAGQEGVLASHRGLDIGSAECARRLAESLQAPLHLAEVSRLLVELNRSPGHPRLFSEFTRGLPRAEREALLASYYHPYRDALRQRIDALLKAGRRVCHVSVHSFTPELDGEVRNADIGLLYDPRRECERRFCIEWFARIRDCGNWRVRRNYPYRGIADGLVTMLRRQRAQAEYVGIELEINQRWPLAGGAAWSALQARIGETLGETLAGFKPVR